MLSLSFLRSFLITALLFLFQGAMAQQGQTLHIVKGKQVTLRADAKHAISYIWFRDAEPLNGLHEKQIVVNEPGVYTVIALGEDCHSVLSDPVEIVYDPKGAELTVDLEIRNLPELNTAQLGQSFNYQLMILNKSDADASDVIVTFDLPRELQYVGAYGSYMGELTYLESQRQVSWKIPKLEAKASMSIWLTVHGFMDGNAITLASVVAKQQDTDLSNNIARSSVDIQMLHIPNVITPNSDGKNDAFVIQGLELFATRKLRIFNRFGNEVYQSSQYQNDWTAQGLKEGTYFYILEIAGEQYKARVIKGYITVIRF